MTQATEKQIGYARKLGIENPENYTKEALSKMIDERTPNSPKKPYKAPESQNIAKHDIVITRIEKPHSFEFGKASKRHKIYYGSVAELKEQYDALKNAGFIDLEDEIEHIKVSE
jgi:hypothetical protein